MAMHILIMEDDDGHRTHIESIVRKQIAKEPVDMELILSSGDPADILDYLKVHPDKRGLYFLDIDLRHHEIDGMELAVKIKAIDPFAKIVFITTKSDLAHLTYEHKLDAIDYILKGRPDDVETRTVESILAAYKRYLEESPELVRYYTVDANGEVWSFAHDDILFFETKSNNKLALHTEYSSIEFRGFLNEVEKLIPEFYRCHKSFLVNLHKIAYIDKAAHEIILVDGRRINIAQKKLSEAAARLETR